MKFKIVSAATLALCAAFGPIGALALLALLVNFSPVASALGTYADILTTTAAEYTTQNAKVKQELWTMDVLDTNGADYQDCPFAELTGRVKKGDHADDSQLSQVVVEITDTRKVHGDTVNIYSTAGVGGEGGSQGDARRGTEADIVSGNMTVTIGNQFFTVGYKQSTVDKNMIGQSVYDNQKLARDLNYLHSTRKNDTILMRLIQASETAIGAQNLLFPENRANREALRAGDTLDKSLINYAGRVLPGLGASQMSTVKDSGGSVKNLFMFMAADSALVDFENDPTNATLLAQGYDRGPGNPNYAGGFVKVGGHGLYRWVQKDHANFKSIGSPLAPRAKLSVALVAANTGSFIQGGGVLAKATTSTTAQWFQHFPNAPFAMYGGVDSIAATTATTRYVKIINNDGTGSAIYSYTVCNGNKITIAARVSGTGSSGTSYNHPIGSVVVPCNSSGCAFVRSVMLGRQAIVGGIGSINGNPASPQMGRVVVEKLDYENDIGVLVEGVAGYSAVKRAGDGAYTGFVLTESALYTPGAENPA